MRGSRTARRPRGRPSAASSPGRPTTIGSRRGATPGRRSVRHAASDERRPSRRHRPGASRGDGRRAHRHLRRPGRPRHELVVRDRLDDGVRDAHAVPLRGIGTRCVGLRDRDRARAGCRIPRSARRAELGGDDERRRRRVRTAGLPVVGRRSVGDLARARPRPGGRHRRRHRDAGLGRVRARRRADGADRAVRLPASGSAVHVSFRLTGLQPGTATASGSWPRAPPAPRRARRRHSAPRARPRDDRGRLLRCTIVGTNGPDRLVGTASVATSSAASAART